jgi:hypothetical protein
MQTQTTADPAAQTLELFTLTTPELPSGIGSRVNKNGAGRILSINITLETRKLVAARLGVTMNKENAPKIDAAILKMKDAVKMAGIGEIAKLAANPNWTGAAFKMSVSKSGKQRATFSLESVNRLGHTVSEDQLVKALASMSEEQQIDIMEKADAAKRELGQAIELADAGDKE